MSVYLAFSDEASVNEIEGEFLVAGYIAKETDWPEFSAAWQDRVLDASPPIPYLHMTEIRSPKFREKHGLTYYDSERRVDEAVRVIYSMGPMSAFCAKLKKDVFERVFVGKKSKHFSYRDPDYLCFLMYVMQTIFFVKHTYHDVKLLNFIAAEKQAIPHKRLKEVVEGIRQLLAEKEPEYASILGDVVEASCSPEHQIPLQAADVLCWHIQRYNFHALKPIVRLERGIENRMWYLLKDRHGHTDELDESLLVEMGRIC